VVRGIAHRLWLRPRGAPTVIFRGQHGEPRVEIPPSHPIPILSGVIERSDRPGYDEFLCRWYLPFEEAARLVSSYASAAIYRRLLNDTGKRIPAGEDVASIWPDVMRLMVDLLRILSRREPPCSTPAQCSC
jgi:hypothetical protein